MLGKADGLPRPGFALQNMRTRAVLLSDVCDTEREAMSLRQHMNERAPSRGAHRIIPVTVTITVMEG